MHAAHMGYAVLHLVGTPREAATLTGLPETVLRSCVAE
jgi:hypothetical protein